MLFCICKSVVNVALLLSELWHKQHIVKPQCELSTEDTDFITAFYGEMKIKVDYVVWYCYYYTVSQKNCAFLFLL